MNDSVIALTSKFSVEARHFNPSILFSGKGTETLNFHIILKFTNRGDVTCGFMFWCCCAVCHPLTRTGCRDAAESSFLNEMRALLRLEAFQI